MIARSKAVARIRTGSALAYRTYVQRLAAWIAAGRRSDLDGWQAALGSWLRMAVLAGAGYAVFRLVRGTPWTMWILVVGWLAAAWRAGKTPRGKDEPPAEEEPEPEEEPLAEADLAEAVRILAAGGHGAHLKALAEHLSEETGKPWTTAAVRAACTAAGIPVTDSVRQPGRSVSTGVRLADLPGPSPSPSSEPGVAVVVAGQDMPTGAATATTTSSTTGDVQVVEGVRMTLVDDPKNPARTAVTVHQ
ncbi:hypothetical protein ACIPY6_02965 [Streptomyces sp. NPDC090054]|uniref:hypothetical protein n=1 Tax=Streptomyces sp. NPDC090054 TaxID=3365933 RepID=UPI00381A1106